MTLTEFRRLYPAAVYEETFGPVKARTVQSVSSFVCQKIKTEPPQTNCT